MRIGSSSAFSIASSGLAAASAALEGSSATSVQDSALAEGGVRVTISPQARSGIDDVRDVSTRLGAVAAYRANLKTLQTADEMDPTKLLP